MARILLIEDEAMLRLTTGDYLRDLGHEVFEAADGPSGIETFERERPEAVLLDLNLPGLPGLEVLSALRERAPDVPVIIVSGAASIQDAVKALKIGASDFITKPVQDFGVLEHAIELALELNRLRQQNATLTRHLLSDELGNPEAFGAIVTADPRMRQVFKYCEVVAQSLEPVLIVGETGTGKELLARAVHAAVPRQGPFVAVNVAGLDEQAFSDTLFGHVKGAYTGAVSARPGLVERAAGGTLFLDEIGEMDMRAQVKLLRVIQEREYFALGSDIPRRMSARILAATNRLTDSGQAPEGMRQDLFFRLKTHLVTIPPLRERRQDVELLVPHFAAEAAASFGREAPVCPAEVLEALKALAYPGNIRELRGLIFDAVARCRGERLRLADFAGKAAAQPAAAPVDLSGLFSALSSLPSPRQAADALVAEAMRRAGGRQSEAARLLGMTPQALSNRLRRGGDG